MISPLEWLETANRRRPKLPHTTEWFSGLTKPKLVGWYERHFTDSPMIGDHTVQWWDGLNWYARPDAAMPHWRQVGEYPAWRGLSAPAQEPGEQNGGA